MGFEPVRRRGSYWEDTVHVDKIIRDFPFHTTGDSEKEFERGFSTTLMAMKGSFQNEVVTQIDKMKTVKSVYAFGKNNRPDLTIGEDGIAFEIKFVTYGGLKEAIGQGYIYRLRYKFVFLILVISQDSKELYFDLDEGKEKDVEDILISLAQEMNIFTYIVPAFDIKRAGVRKCIGFFS